MTRKQHLNRRMGEKGNIFFTLFAAVGVVGAIGIGSITLLKGPVQTMVRSNQQTVIDNKSELNLRVMINDILQNTPDCDGDGTIEAAEWEIPLLNQPIPIGGGLFPDAYGTNITDPWGNRFGYCVWDHGTTITDGVTDNGCGATPNFLQGYNGIAQPFITIISSGPNKVFETTCNDFVDTTPVDGAPDTPLIVRAANSDDQINTYTYADARNTMGDNWVFESNNPADDDAAKTTQNLEFSQNVTFNGLLDMSRLGGGLTLPDIAAGISCGASNEGDLFRDSASIPPAIVMCQSGAFVAVAGDGTGSGDVVIPDPNFDPESANCLINTGGPFVEVSSDNPGGLNVAVWGDKSYLYNGLNDRLSAYNTSGGVLNLVNTNNNASQSTGVWGDGQYIYSSNRNANIAAYSFDGTTLTKIDDVVLGTAESGDIWGDGQYIYASLGTEGIGAYSFDGTTLTEITRSGTGDFSRAIWGDGEYIYSAHGGTLRAFSFDGTTFTQEASTPSGGVAYGVWGDGTYIYLSGNGVGVRAYTFNGTTFTLVGSSSISALRKIWGDGTHIFAADRNNGVRAFQFNGTAFTLVDTFDTPSAAEDVWGDGQFIYVADSNSVRAYSGFECTRANTSVQRTFEDDVGVDYNYRAYSWGRDLNGSLGNGGVSDEHQNVPTPIINHNEFYKVSMERWGSNNKACGIKTDGAAYCWGTNGRGALGLGFESATPVQAPEQPVIGNHKFQKIQLSGFAACGLTLNGRVLCWGRGHATLGTGNLSNQLEPAPINTAHTDFVDLAASNNSMCALRENGDIYCWGVDQDGQLGNGPTLTTDVLSPSKINSSVKFVKIEGGEDRRYCGITDKGEAWCWGNNVGSSAGTSIIGNGSLDAIIHSPEKVSVVNDFTEIAVGSNHNCGVRKNGEMWCWGEDSGGQLGNGTGVTHSPLPSRVLNINDFIKVTVKGGGTCGIVSSGEAYCWGNDSNGSNGTGGAGNTHIPSQVLNVGNFVDIDCHGQGCLGVAKIERDAIDSGTTEPVQIYQSNTSGNTVASHGLAVTLNSGILNHEAGIGLRTNTSDVAPSDTIGAFIGARKASSLSEAGNLIFRTNDGTTQPEISLTKDGSLAINSDATNFSGARLGIGQRLDWFARQYYDGLLVRHNSGTPAVAYYGLNSLTGHATILSGKELLIQHTDVTGTTVNTVADFSSSTTPIFYGDMNIFGNGKSASIEGYSDTATARAAFEFLRYRGTSAAPSAVTSGDTLGEIIFNAHDGTSYGTDGYASIKANVAGTVSSGNVPTNLLITHPDGSASGADYLQIDSTGKVNIGAASNTTGQINAAGRGAADKAIKPGFDTRCSSTDDEGTIRIFDNEYQYCDGFQWISLVDPKTCVDDAKIIDITADDTTACATLSNGQSVCWGQNTSGLYSGNGITTHPLLTLKPITLLNAIQTAPGAALTKDGVIKTWGNNNLGQLGNGLTTSSIHPVSIASNKKFDKISGTRDYSCGIDDIGHVWCWGQNDFGQVGNGTTQDSRIPTKVRHVGNAIDISTGPKHACALSADRTVKCWGRNDVGNLGRGTQTINEKLPAPVLEATSGNPILSDVISISAGGRIAGGIDGTCAVKENGTVWCWGDNSAGQIGNGTSGSVDVLYATQVSGISNAIQVSRFHWSACALLENGTVRCWGGGGNGLIGNGGTANQTTSVPVSGLSDAIKLANAGAADHMCAIRSEGGAVCWGNNSNGELGDGTTTTALTPVDVINPLSCNSDKFVFATSALYNGSLGGVAGANAICQKHADQANLPGRYLAWISDNLGNAPTNTFNRLTDSYDYIRVNGSKHSDGWIDMIDGNIDLQLSVDEFGNNTTPNPNAWTGTTFSGTSQAENCNNWTNSTSQGRIGFGSSIGSQWTDASTANCVAEYRLYCFQQ